MLYSGSARLHALALSRARLFIDITASRGLHTVPPPLFCFRRLALSSPCPTPAVLELLEQHTVLASLLEFLEQLSAVCIALVFARWVD